jgi:ribose transport system substrate-binding protein
MKSLASRGRRYGIALAVTLAVTTAVAACSTGASTAGAGGGASSGTGFLSQSVFDTMTSRVNAAAAVPKFVPPGPAFDISKAKGKRLFVIPTASQLPVCDQISKSIVALAPKVGMTGHYFQNSGGAAGWIPGIQQAISEHYDAIVLICGIDPNLIKPQLQAAEHAGIAVIDSGLGDTTQGDAFSPLVTAQTNVPNAVPMRDGIDKAILDNRQAPFDIFEITSNDVPSGVIMDKAMRAELAQYCPKCGIKSTNIAVPDWATKVQSAVSSALQADPKIKVVVPIFDGEVPPASAGIRAAGRHDVNIYATYGGTPEYIAQMGGGLAMKSEVGPTQLWRAYATMDQTLRVLSDNKPVGASKDGDPSRLFTVDNYKQSATGANGGFGSAFIGGYEKLWGIG